VRKFDLARPAAARAREGKARRALRARYLAHGLPGADHSPEGLAEIPTEAVDIPHQRRSPIVYTIGAYPARLARGAVISLPMELEALCVLRAVAEQESVDKETKKPFKWYQVCLQTDDGLSVFTVSTEPDQTLGAPVLAKFKKVSYDGKDKIKLVALENPPIR